MNVRSVAIRVFIALAAVILLSFIWPWGASVLLWFVLLAATLGLLSFVLAAWDVYGWYDAKTPARRGVLVKWHLAAFFAWMPLALYRSSVHLLNGMFGFQLRTNELFHSIWGFPWFTFFFVVEVIITAASIIVAFLAPKFSFIRVVHILGALLSLFALVFALHVFPGIHSDKVSTATPNATSTPSADEICNNLEGQIESDQRTMNSAQLIMSENLEATKAYQNAKTIDDITTSDQVEYQSDLRNNGYCWRNLPPIKADVEAGSTNPPCIFADGSKSTNSSAEFPLTYQWYLVENSSTAADPIRDQGANFHQLAQFTGLKTIRLIVNDVYGQTAVDSDTVRIDPSDMHHGYTVCNADGSVVRSSTTTPSTSSTPTPQPATASSAILPDGSCRFWQEIVDGSLGFQHDKGKFLARGFPMFLRASDNAAARQAAEMYLKWIKINGGTLYAANRIIRLDNTVTADDLVQHGTQANGQPFGCATDKARDVTQLLRDSFAKAQITLVNSVPAGLYNSGVGNGQLWQSATPGIPGNTKAVRLHWDDLGDSRDVYILGASGNLAFGQFFGATGPTTN